MRFFAIVDEHQMHRQTPFKIYSHQFAIRMRRIQHLWTIAAREVAHENSRDTQISTRTTFALISIVAIFIVRLFCYLHSRRTYSFSK